MGINSSPAQKEVLQYEDEKVWHDDEFGGDGWVLGIWHLLLEKIGLREKPNLQQ